MKIKNLFYIMAAGSMILVSCNSQKKGLREDIDLKTTIDSVSYGLGISIAENMVRNGIDSLNYEAFAVALFHVFEGKKAMLTEEEANEMLQVYFDGIQSKKFEKNKNDGQKFLDDNKNQPGVIVLQSGLQYKIEVQGTGVTPGLTDKVKVHYKGTMLDGKVFDSSYDRNEPVVFGVSEVIKGWTEILQLMPVGSKYTVYVPQDLAYGERGAGQIIPPYSTLIFEIELLSIEK